eukprot:jgi/Mesen1/7718/ME000406S06938
MRTSVLFAIVLAFGLVTIASAACPKGSGQYGPDCLDCPCVNGVCDDGPTGNGTCTCVPGSHTNGAFCQNCDDNYDPSTGCATIVDPCTSCFNGTCSSTNICSAKSTCNNFDVGKFRCDCYRGYKKVTKTSCVDIDECASKNQCPTYSKCINTAGSYRCACNKGRKAINFNSAGRPHYCIKA